MTRVVRFITDFNADGMCDPGARGIPAAVTPLDRRNEM